jgi:hypothetical protein
MTFSVHDRNHLRKIFRGYQKVKDVLDGGIQVMRNSLGALSAIWNASP